MNKRLIFNAMDKFSEWVLTILMNLKKTAKNEIKHLTIILKVLFCLCFLEQSSAQAPLLNENFEYPSGDLLTAHGWIAYSATGSAPITVNAGGLTFPGYIGSGIGNAALVDYSGEDIYKAFTTQNSGTVYAAFMVKITTVAPGYFFHFSTNPAGTNFLGRVFMDATNHFGVSFGSSTGTYAGTTFTIGNTYLLVVKYQIVSGTLNDIVSMYIFDSSFPSTEPATPTIGPLTNAAIQDINPGSVAIRQYNVSENLLIDGIRVGTSWTDIAGIGPTNFNATAINPSQINLSFTPNASNNVVIVWNNSGSFSNPSGTPPSIGNTFAGGTLIYNGTTSPIYHTGLNQNTKYYYALYPYTGTIYSSGELANATTPCNIYNVPYTENFESAIVPALPSCTSIQNTGTGNNWITVSNPGNGFATKALKYSFHPQYAANAWFYTRGVNLIGGTVYRLDFKYGNDVTNYNEKLKVLYGASPNNTAMTNLLFDLPTINQAMIQNAYCYFTPTVSGIFYFGFNCYSAIDQSYLYVDDIKITKPIKSLKLEVCLEGLYNESSGSMLKAQGNSGGNFSGTIADQVTIKLAQEVFPYSVVYQKDSVNVNQNGQFTVYLPGNIAGNYYLVVRHRNSIETWSAFPIPINQDTVEYNFANDFKKAFNNNLKLIGSRYTIYAGDINQDGFVNDDDLTILGEQSSQFTTGYHAADANGDGVSDALDMIMVDNNASVFARSYYPDSPNTLVVTTNLINTQYGTAYCGGTVVSQGSSPVTARGICWGVSPNPTLSNDTSIVGSGAGSFTSYLKSLSPYTTYFIRAYATNFEGTVYGNELNTTTSEWVCGTSTLTINHVAMGGVAPLDKTATYGTATLIPGEPAKCWITSNLGASNLALSVDDSTEASAGWYWQFNRKKGFKNNGITLMPNSTWISSINENANWMQINDPCPDEFGSGWRIPTKTEWINLVASGNWTNWYEVWDSDLKLHAAGVLDNSDGLLINRGYGGYYWSSTQSSTIEGWSLNFDNINCYMDNSLLKAYGLSVRCLRDASEPTVITTSITNITQTSSFCGGTVSNIGVAPVISKGVCWSVIPDPTIADSITTDGIGTGIFVSNITNLTPNTFYYVRAYATNSIGTAYGNTMTFSTLIQGIPTLSTKAATNITQTTATSGGIILSEGDTPITAKGICWGTTTYPTISDNHTLDGDSTIDFTSSINGLTSNITYYLRAYAINSIGIAYGNEVSFTSLWGICGSSTLVVNHTTTDSVAPIDKTVTYSTVANIPGEPNKCWITQNLGAANQATSATDAAEASAGWYFQFNRKQGYKHNGTTRTPSILWDVTNDNLNAAWEADKDPCTLELGSEWRLPTSTEWANVDAIGGWTTWTNPYESNLKLHGAGYLNYIGGSLLSRGVNGNYWSNAQINVNNGWYLFFGSGYSYMNSTNKAYGFTARCLRIIHEKPVVTTSSFTNITQTTASNGGNVISDGGSPVTSKGVCWSTIASPTIADNHTSDGMGNGEFISNLSGLTPNVQYYVRAYATNGVGTAYGINLIVNTLIQGAPSVTTTVTTSIAQTTATSGGNITNQGDAPVTSKGVCWSTSGNPTIANSHISDGGGTGSFSISVYGLTSGNAYFIRAYATNIFGTSYGNELSFTTLTCGSPILVDHTADAVAPVTKTVEYNTVANLPGESSKCWITSNLGADQQANEVTDTTEASAGWYWQFNRKQGYKHNGTIRTPNSTWITNISESSDWIAANDPCNIEIGLGWRIPTNAEWNNIDATGNWASWSDPWNSGLKLHAAGWLYSANGSLEYRGIKGYYQSSTQYNATNSHHLLFESGQSSTSNSSKALGFSVRCLRNILETPTITTASITNISQNTAISGGNISIDGGAVVTARGVCWSNFANPSTTDNHTSDGTGIGAFVSNITGLIPNTLYFIRAYSTNSTGTSYGNNLTLTTLIQEIPTISTNLASNITQTTATSGGNVISDGGAAVLYRGICWSTSMYPTITDSHTTDGTGKGLFVSNLSGLNEYTTYYIRAYATNSIGTAYGSELSFTTLALPTVTTNAVTNICSSNADCGGVVTGSGGTDIIARGICWNTSANPTIADNHTSNGIGVGAFVNSLTSLNANTLYYVRAYATNSVGTAYGAELTFTTLPSFFCGCPLTINHLADSIAPVTKIVTYGTVTNIPGESSRCWITRNLGATNQATSVSDANETSAGWYWQFNKKQGYKHDGTTRTPVTTWINSISENSDWLAANDPCALELGSGWRIPTNTEWINVDATANWTDWNSLWNSALKLHAAGSLVLNDGSLGNRGSYGSYWSNTQSNLSFGWLLNFSNNSSSVAGSSKATGYTARCLSNNGVPDVTPTVTTATVYNIGPITAVSGGNVTSYGVSSETVRGVCWSTSPNPTIVNSHTSDGTGYGIFASNLSDLTPNTLYYIRAYATNSAGTSYGEELSFSTLLNPILPVISTVEISNLITQSSAIGGGYVTFDGGANVFARGVCYGTSSNPTTANNYTIDGTGNGLFSSSLINLDSNTPYYVRAYATNSAGTEYGNEINFTTLGSCGSYTISHIASTVVPVTKTVTYNTVTNIPGEPTKCWITQNLGANNQASSVSDATDASAGWYWQFNRKQGYKHDGTTRTPPTAWIGSIIENSDWIVANDPCNIELGSGWRLPTSTEWTNVDGSGVWSAWTGPFDSGLKLHAAGYLLNSSGFITNRGSIGDYWSSTQYDASNGRNMYMYSSDSKISFTNKALGFSARCLKVAGSTNTVPTVSTASVTNLTQTFANSGGIITTDGGATVTARGVCWSTVINPTITDSHTTDGVGSGIFISNLTELTPSTHYYLRSYATNSIGTAYGSQVDFTSLELPVVTTTTITNICSASAKSGGNVSMSGASNKVTARGVCWNIASNPTADGYHTSDGTGLGTYVSTLTGLASNTMYYVRAFATNSVDTAYGTELTFTTSPTFLCGCPITVNHIADSVAPVSKTVTYSTVANIPGESSKCWITSNLGATNQATSVPDSTEAAAGWYWKFNRTQGYMNDGTSCTPNTSWNTFTENSDWLAINDPCTLEIGIEWRLPTNTEWTNVDATGGWTNWNNVFESNLKLHGAGYLNGGLLGFRGNWGIYWSGTQSNTSFGRVIFLSSEAVYITESVKFQGYSIRCLRVLAEAPFVTTALFSDITQTTATNGGNVTSDGGSAVTSRGVCWSTVANPTIADSYTIDGMGTGEFFSNITGLIPNTQYYVRAYATNGFGTAYGNNLILNTLIQGIPTLSTIAVTNITPTTAISGGLITDEGDAPVSARGICWGLNTNPTITDNHTSDGDSIGIYTSEIIGLTPNENYYLRAYAVNSLGTAYGNELNITTLVVCEPFITINHVVNTVAPVSKTVTYGIVTNIPGATTKCWITSNLGATNQATSVSDNSEAAAGWYWQFNKKQGYKHDGSSRTPATAWIYPISENSNWLATNDPCTLELGSGWRLPTSTEWSNVVSSGGWTFWSGPYSSSLKLHAGGYLRLDGSLGERGSFGSYNSSTQIDDSHSEYLYFYSSGIDMGGDQKAFGFQVRCLKDY
jgi:hypothetical protein